MGESNISATGRRTNGLPDAGDQRRDVVHHVHLEGRAQRPHETERDRKIHTGTGTDDLRLSAACPQDVRRQPTVTNAPIASPGTPNKGDYGCQAGREAVVMVTEGDNPGGEAVGEAPEMTGSSPRRLPWPASPA